MAQVLTPLQLHEGGQTCNNSQAKWFGLFLLFSVILAPMMIHLIHLLVMFSEGHLANILAATQEHESGTSKGVVGRDDTNGLR